MDSRSFWQSFIGTKIIKIVQLHSWQLVHQRYVDKLIELTTNYVTQPQCIQMLGSGREAWRSFRLKCAGEIQVFKGINGDVRFYLRKNVEDFMNKQIALGQG